MGDILEHEQIAMQPDDNVQAPEFQMVNLQDREHLRGRLGAAVSAPITPVEVLLDHDYL